MVSKETVLSGLVRAAWAAAILAALFLLALIIGGIVPANPAWQPPETGHEIFVETNGVHSGIIIARRGPGYDLSDLFAREHLAEPQLYGTHVAVGWGEANFYRNTRTWAELDIGRTWAALTGSNDTVLHIRHLYRPRAFPYYRRSVIVDAAALKTIADSIRAQVRRDAVGEVHVTPAYRRNDLFYRSRSTYSLANSCNVWTGRLLADAGLRVGIWPVLDGGVMRWFAERPNANP
jgi:uncharacterized protein (TIGR02117 family)